MQNEELRRTQAELAAANERYSSFYDLAPVGFCSLNENGLILESNLTFAAWTGKARSELFSQSFNHFILPEDQDIYSLHHCQLFETGNPQTCELRLLRQDKKELWVNIKTTASQSPEGAPVCLMVLCDITERKRTEKTLASIFDAISEPVFLMDSRSVFLTVNKAGAQRFGMSPEDMKNKKTSELSPKDIAKSRLKKLKEVFRKGKEVHFEDSRNGAYLKHALYPVFDDNEKVVHVAGFVQDITELRLSEKALRESEEKARALLDATDDAVVLFDRDGVFLDMNDAYAGLINMEKETFIGKCIWDYFPQEIAAYRKEFLEQIFLTGQPAVLTDKRNNRFYDSRAYPILNAAGVTTRVALFIRDITEKKQAEDELKASHARLRELSKYLQATREDYRKRIARGIHDELGQVLTAIILEASWLSKKLTKRQTALKESAEAMADLAKGAIQSVKKIIAELRPSLLSDLGLAEAIKWQVGEYQKRTGIKCSLCIDLDDSDLNDEISTAVFRIFQESFTNVMRHANATEMQVSLQKIEDDIELIVEDKGIGADGYLNSGKDDFGIIGMKERAQALGGQFEISGIPGKGTVVVTRIPVDSNPPA